MNHMSKEKRTRCKIMRQILNLKRLKLRDLDQVHDLFEQLITEETREQLYDQQENNIPIDEYAKILVIICQGMMNGSPYVDPYDSESFKMVRAIFRMILTSTHIKGLFIKTYLGVRGLLNWMYTLFDQSDLQEIQQEVEKNEKQQWEKWAANKNDYQSPQPQALQQNSTHQKCNKKLEGKSQQKFMQISKEIFLIIKQLHQLQDSSDRTNRKTIKTDNKYLNDLNKAKKIFRSDSKLQYQLDD